VLLVFFKCWSLLSIYRWFIPLTGLFLSPIFILFYLLYFLWTPCNLNCIRTYWLDGFHVTLARLKWLTLSYRPELPWIDMLFVNLFRFQSIWPRSWVLVFNLPYWWPLLFVLRPLTTPFMFKNWLISGLSLFLIDLDCL